MDAEKTLMNIGDRREAPTGRPEALGLTCVW
jgi:hypothetical protein